MVETVSASPQCSGFEKELTLDNDKMYNSTAMMRVACAIVFCIFTFCYLYFYQADVLTVEQHVLSGGVTHYNRLVGAVLITMVLYFIQVGVYAITRLYKRTHALTYFPSLLFLVILTSAGPEIVFGFQWGAWVWLAPLLLVVYVFVIWQMRQYQPYEPEMDTIGLFSRLMWTNMLTMFVMFFLVGLCSSHQDALHYRLRMESKLSRGDVDGVLEIGEKSRVKDDNLTMLRAYALAQKGKLGDQLFEYPISGKCRSLLPEGETVKCLFYPEVEIRRLASSKAADDYRLCNYLLEGKLEQFAKSVIKCYDVTSSQLPKHYREALTLYTHRSDNPVVSFHSNVLDADYDDMQNLEKQYSNDIMRENAVRDVYGNTYWYYYLYERN